MKPDTGDLRLHDQPQNNGNVDWMTLEITTET